MSEYAPRLPQEQIDKLAADYAEQLKNEPASKLDVDRVESSVKKLRKELDRSFTRFDDSVLYGMWGGPGLDGEAKWRVKTSDIKRVLDNQREPVPFPLMIACMALLVAIAALVLVLLP